MAPVCTLPNPSSRSKCELALYVRLGAESHSSWPPFHGPVAERPTIADVGFNPRPAVTGYRACPPIRRFTPRNGRQTHERDPGARRYAAIGGGIRRPRREGRPPAVRLLR